MWLWLVLLLPLGAIALYIYQRTRKTPQDTSGKEKHEAVPPGPRRRIRTDNISKEVEIAFEAGELIEFPSGATSQTMSREVRTRSRAVYGEEKYDLPDRYGSNRLVLLPRDPRWLYAYWDVTHEKYKEILGERYRELSSSKPTIRIYDVTAGEVLEVPVHDHTDNWYIRADRPRHLLFAEFGRVFPEGSFIPVLRSNYVTMPPAGVSGVYDEKWMPAGTVPGWVGSQASSPLSWRKNG